MRTFGDDGIVVDPVDLGGGGAVLVESPVHDDGRRRLSIGRTSEGVLVAFDGRRANRLRSGGRLRLLLGAGVVVAELAEGCE